MSIIKKLESENRNPSYKRSVDATFCSGRFKNEELFEIRTSASNEAYDKDKKHKRQCICFNKVIALELYNELKKFLNI